MTTLPDWPVSSAAVSQADLDTAMAARVAAHNADMAAITARMDRLDDWVAPAPTGVEATDTANLNAAMVTADTLKRRLVLRGGNYLYNGDGLTRGVADRTVIVGQGRKNTTITLAAGARFLAIDFQAYNLYLADFTIVGGDVQVWSRVAGANVHEARVFARMDFTGYTSAAVATTVEATVDNPYWHFDLCKFNAANDTSTIGVALGTAADGSSFHRCSFERNRVHVKGRSALGNILFSETSFLRFSAYSGTPRIDLWAVTDTGSWVGAGLSTVACKFGNEGLDNHDYRVLYAAEDTGTNILDKWPLDAACPTTHKAWGAYFGAGTFVHGNGLTGGGDPAFLTSRCSNLQGFEVDVIWGSSAPKYHVKHEYFAWTAGSGMRALSNKIRANAPSSGATVPRSLPSNTPYLWALVDDPQVRLTGPDDFAPYHGGGDATTFKLITAIAATSLTGGSGGSRVGVTDALGGTDAVEVTVPTVSGNVFVSLASPDQARPLWVEFDVKLGASPGATTDVKVVFGKSTGPEGLVRYFPLTANWVRYRVPWVDGVSADVFAVYGAQAAGTFQLGRVAIYHSREAVDVKSAIKRDTTGLTSAQIDALTGVVAVDGAHLIHDSTQGRVLHRVGGKWRYAATTLIA